MDCTTNKKAEWDIWAGYFSSERQAWANGLGQWAENKWWKEYFEVLHSVGYKVDEIFF